MICRKEGPHIQHKLKKLLSLLLCAALVLVALPAPARALTLTAVNDTLLPLSDSTMPARLGGELYVPYSVFSSLGVSASSDSGVLNLSASGETLSFSTEEGYVYDQNLNSYPSPAYDMNGTVYVPVKLCCGKFGLNYSTLSAYGETVLRITDGSAQSDSSFVSDKGSAIESAINTYKGISPSQPTDGGQTQTPTQPTEPPIPEVEEQPAQKPSRVYLTFYGAPTSSTTPAILDALQSAGRSATFFLPTDTSTWPDDLIRRIVAEGHTPALLLAADGQTAPGDLVAALSTANDKLNFLTGVSARIISNESGCKQLTQAQRDALTGAGYRLWDATLDCGDDTQSAARAYATTAQRFTTTTAALVVKLHHHRNTAQTVQLLTAYMSRQGIPSPRITFGTTPMNTASDTR